MLRGTDTFGQAGVGAGDSVAQDASSGRTEASTIRARDDLNLRRCVAVVGVDDGLLFGKFKIQPPDFVLRCVRLRLRLRVGLQDGLV